MNDAPSPGWTALLLAGQRPGTDAMAAHFGVAAKALIPVAGRSMLDRVARTLLESPSIDRIVLLAQDPAALATGDTAWLANDTRIRFAPSASGISASVTAIAGTPVAPWPILVTTADHPLLTPDMIETFVAGAAGTDVAVGVVGRRVLLAAYPDNRRTWLVFSDDAYSGANLFALNGPGAHAALAKWAEVERDRKKAWRLIAQFGPLLALRALTRTIAFAPAMAQAAARIGCTAKPVILSQAEAAIDVDKPSDHALAESILRTREA